MKKVKEKIVKELCDSGLCKSMAEARRVADALTLKHLIEKGILNLKQRSK